MVLPILEAKFDLGLFDHPYVDEASVDTVLNRPEGIALERKLAGRSMVLLRNENRTLPLSKDLKKVAVIGPLADASHDIEGGWTVEGLFGKGSKSHPVTVLAGIRNRLVVPMRKSRLSPGLSRRRSIPVCWSSLQVRSLHLHLLLKKPPNGLPRPRQRPPTLTSSWP
ncbi:glycoside hydrolase family 3 C-terminal domain-containing protein [Tunturibacter empetritectus]|nr:glycoside hydrolase family 3 C-terminal domain-containing protein [Edaphobacter lichenicola]